MQIKACLDEILTRTAAHPFLEAQNISFEERPPDAAYITGEVAFIDGSRLHFKEFVIFGSETIKVVKYGYNYLSSLNDLIFRYDTTSQPGAWRRIPPTSIPPMDCNRPTSRPLKMSCWKYPIR